MLDRVASDFKSHRVERTEVIDARRKRWECRPPLSGETKADERSFKKDAWLRGAKQRQPSGREELLSTMIQEAVAKEE